MIRYVPVLPVKQGELLALSALTPADRYGMTPLFVLPASDGGSGVPAEQELDNAVFGVARHWGAEPAFLDVGAAGDEPTPRGLHPLADSFLTARERGLALVPVTPLTASSTRLLAARDVAAVDGRGLCLRLPLREWVALGPDGALPGVLRQLRVTPAEVDLVLDLGGHARSVRALADVARTVDRLPWLGAWRSLVVTGTAYPPRVGDGLSEVPRIEWTDHLRLRESAVARLPVFGDYGVTHPDAFARSSYVHEVRAVLRYTTPETWVLVRGDRYVGRDGEGIGADAVPPIAAQLRSHPRFDFAQHCPMERWVARVAYLTTGGGDPKTWHRHATHHHLVVVGEQLDRLAGDQGSAIAADRARAHDLDG